MKACAASLGGTALANATWGFNSLAAAEQFPQAVIPAWRRLAKEFGEKHQVDMSGDGFKLAFVSGTFQLRTGELQRNFHSNQEEAMLVGKYGLLPKSVAKYFSINDQNDADFWYLRRSTKSGELVWYHKGNRRTIEDSIKVWKLIAEYKFAHTLLASTKRLRELVDIGKGDFLAAEMPLSISVVRVGHQLLRLLEDYQYLFPNVRQRVFGKSLASARIDSRTEALKLRIIRGQLGELGLLPGGNLITRLLSEYQKAVDRVVNEADCVLVCSVGNESQQAMDRYTEIGFKERDFQNYLCVPEAIVRAAGVNTNNTILDLADDTVSLESTQGIDQQRPNLAAPSVQVEVIRHVDGEETSYEKSTMNGTSAATVLTAGAAALARIASGNSMTARQTIDAMTQTAYKSDLGENNVGAGILDFKKLLEYVAVNYAS